jgi:hypothetical protein
VKNLLSSVALGSVLVLPGVVGARAEHGAGDVRPGGERRRGRLRVRLLDLQRDTAMSIAPK